MIGLIIPYMHINITNGLVVEEILTTIQDVCSIFNQVESVATKEKTEYP